MKEYNIRPKDRNVRQNRHRPVRTVDRCVAKLDEIAAVSSAAYLANDAYGNLKVQSQIRITENKI